MAELNTYRVLREHYGDRQYFEGDTREMTAAEAKTLLELGVLGEPELEAKAEAPLTNKAEGAAPHNKGGRKPASIKE